MKMVVRIVAVFTMSMAAVGETNKTRRQMVRKKTGQYLLRAELIFKQYIRADGRLSPWEVSVGLPWSICCLHTRPSLPQVIIKCIFSWGMLSLVSLGTPHVHCA